MNLAEWAARWNVSPAALFDLQMRLGVAVLPRLDAATAPGSESRQQQLIRLDAAEKGVWLTRNNVGAFLDKRDIPVRFGLCNESKEMNRVVKSADLIGIKTILITPQHVGHHIGQFACREVKKESWQWSGDDHENAQLNFAKLVLSKGGDAGFATGPGTFG